jgi:hypothetical protein
VSSRVATGAAPGVRVPAIFHLLGLPGVGKLTVAGALVDMLAAAGETARVVDNHLTANPVLTLVAEPFPDGRLDPDVGKGIAAIRAVVFDMIERISPRAWSFVFTNFVAAHDSIEGARRLRELAAARQSTYVPVHLDCDIAEGLRRVEAEDRASRAKLRDPSIARALYEAGPNVPDWPDLLRVDVTDLAPGETATLVVAHRERLSARSA